jgi:lipoic acid synthetase
VNKAQRPIAKPPWLKRRLPTGPAYESVRALLRKGGLHTVCQEAQCPNVWECFSEHTATFLIMGDRCTRNCRFCAVAHGPDSPPDADEAEKLADAVDQLGLNYVVITSVTRDDLPDGGAGCFAAAIREVRKKCPETLIEVLIPDLQGDAQALATILAARPNILNHNIETVPRLYSLVRPEADYQRSLQLLHWAQESHPEIPTKSGLMLGLGETADEIRQTLKDLYATGCRMLTLGQYLQPSKQHLPVKRFVPPEEFENWRDVAQAIGFDEIASGPFVRSSYHAKELFQHLNTGM